MHKTACEEIAMKLINTQYWKDIFNWSLLKKDWGTSFYSKEYTESLCEKCKELHSLVETARNRNRKRIMFFIIVLMLVNFLTKIF